MKHVSAIRVILAINILNVAGCSDDGSVSPQPTNQVLWDVGYVRLEADDFYIEAKGIRYLANVDSVSIGGNPGDDSTRTLELEWTEHGNPMRLYIYFMADSTDWWSDEIRTYDGTIGDGTQWVYYFGEFFKSARGASFTGDIELINDASDNNVEGKLHFTGIQLTVF